MNTGASKVLSAMVLVDELYVPAYPPPMVVSLTTLTVIPKSGGPGDGDQEGVRVGRPAPQRR